MTDVFDQMVVGVQHAVIAAFVPWIRAVKAGDKAPLETTLRDMHKLIASGGYTGHMGRDGFNVSIAPGTMLREYRQWHERRYVLNADPEVLPEMRGLSLAHLPLGLSRKPLPFLPEWGWPQIRKEEVQNEAGETRARFVYEYVPAQLHRHCIVAMGKELRAAVSMLEGGDTEAFVEALARYHYIGISTQLFQRVNNSLLMAQVNHLLAERGLRGLPHGRLDYEALVLASDDYVARFKEVFAQHNPDALPKDA